MAISEQSPVLGVLISEIRPKSASGQGESKSPSTLPEDSFCRLLSSLSHSLGLLVYFFCATSVPYAANRLLRGYQLRGGEWQAGSFPLPDLVYDRALPKSSDHYALTIEALNELKRLKPYTLLNGSLPGKLYVYSVLSGNAKIAPHVPRSIGYSGTHSLELAASQHADGIFMKPSAGAQGRGAFRLIRAGDGWQIDGRDRRNRPLSHAFTGLRSASSWIGRFTAGAPYVIQPCLKLIDEDGCPFDVRSLVQKDGFGRWTFTGAAVRTGESGSVTSNLHGGGTAANAEDALAGRFGEEAAARMLQLIRRISECAAEVLEQHFGRLAELGIDFGIEQDGRIWLLEANSRPGRQSFEDNERTYETAVLRPLQYALHVAARQKPVFQSNRNQGRYIQEVHP
ncbi:glutathione synthase/RimK-type ligase-like ATP-grasp enzyme [Paenibacillus taihuensis]|uniref:Glutathione synthase/RimK-type ligase-like ATP-grasp enzyme n=1 Tax=Paenibacillus taihuensis TaxID=1156355 RepID=A0A3D9RYN9_9BACL|nr:YheC/YheD family protein [Paenibacillus taihuensis]REE82674.1 glutathione synthase/RimK-type ligase-like ATP-grasp enzyme [Paenibacillus taihuensis]